jgi:HAD superfamily hydrolase (TIGR01450 family)
MRDRDLTDDRLAGVRPRFVDLVDRYDGFLFDAYGVLVDSGGVLPGAREALAAVRAAGKPLHVVTNDASRLPATAAARFARVGLDVAAAEIASSGMLLAPYVAARRLGGGRALVLGTDDARAYARGAGLEVVGLGADLDVLVVADDGGFEILDGVNAALTGCVRALDAGRAVALVCPNPDLVYPRGGGALGVTAGALALMLEAGIRRCHPAAPRFTYLGKPAPGLFELARSRMPAGARLLMVGDQLETDIAGARAAGLDAALITGVSRWHPGAVPPEAAPHHVLDGLG